MTDHTATIHDEGDLARGRDELRGRFRSESGQLSARVRGETIAGFHGWWCLRTEWRWGERSAEGAESSSFGHRRGAIDAEAIGADARDDLRVVGDQRPTEDDLYVTVG